MRETGILMPVSSLPSHTGVGELGKETEKFIGYLRVSGVKIWQILPLNPVGYGNSPYQPYSSCAGDEIYISLEKLWEQKLLKELPVSELAGSTRVQYEQVRTWKETYLREAFQAFIEKGLDRQRSIRRLLHRNGCRNTDCSVHLRKQTEDSAGMTGSRNIKTGRNTKRKLRKRSEKRQTISLLQYLFYCPVDGNEECCKCKWDPHYGGRAVLCRGGFCRCVGGKEKLLLDTDGRPIFIAGVPPDYFSATGQRWGNPIYDWEYLKKQNYQFWVDRIGYSSRLFDIIRIDHFRAFDTFWKIPASCPTAVEGEWILAPGYEVIDTLLEKIPEVNLVAEDLGDLRPEVLELKEHYHFKGMKILVFSIDTSGKYAKDIFMM